MVRGGVAVLITFLFAFLCGEQAGAEQEVRIALVIGNGAYKSAPLENPPNDARLMATTLRALGFDVVEKLDVDQKEMRRAILDFGDLLAKERNAAVGLFYYAGHGIQAQGRNFLLPVDADIGSEKDVFVEAIDVDGVLRSMEYARSRVNFIVLDACRNNPFARSSRSGTMGLAHMDAPRGTLIAYATGPGRVAVDGETANSPYTLALAQEMREPGIPVEKVFRRVRNTVMEVTRDQQVPWESSSLTGGDFYFKTDTVASSTSLAALAASEPSPVHSGKPYPTVAPGRSFSFPSDEVVALPGAIAPPPSTESPVSFQVRFVTRGKDDTEFRGIVDGDVLNSGDLYKIIFSAQEDSFIYIFQVESSGRVYQLFPMESFRGTWVGNANPVRSGRTYFLPKESKAYQLDDQTGLERIFVLASRTQDKELENLAETITSHRSTGNSRALGSAETKLKTLFKTRAIRTRKKEKPSAHSAGDTFSWQEDGKMWEIVSEKLEDFCDGCMYLLQFEHK